MAESPPLDPSKPLKNHKHELFIQGLLKGKSQIEAYMQAFSASKRVADANAFRVMGNDGVSARFQFLQAKASEKTVITLEESLKYLTDAILTSPDKIDASSILCQDYTVAENGTVKCRPVDKLKSMEILSKLAGRLVDRQEVKHEFVLTPDQEQASDSFAQRLSSK